MSRSGDRDPPGPQHMKILILAHARSGSTTLGKWLSKELNYIFFDEPHNIENGIEIYGNNNYVVKDLYSHLFSNKIDIEKYISNFDYVIGLYRMNVKDIWISMEHANKTKRHHSQYKLSNEEIEEYEKSIPENLIEGLIKEREKITEYSNIVLVYEKIYETKEDIQKLKKFLDIENFNYLDMLDNKNRYRRKKIKLI